MVPKSDAAQRKRKMQKICQGDGELRWESLARNGLGRLTRSSEFKAKMSPERCFSLCQQGNRRSTHNQPHRSRRS